MALGSPHLCHCVIFLLQLNTVGSKGMEGVLQQRRTAGEKRKGQMAAESGDNERNPGTKVSLS